MLLIKAKRLLGAGRHCVQEAAIRLGIAQYRRPFEDAKGDWNEAYASGEHDHYRAFGERPRYAVLHGYVGARDSPVSILDVGCGEGLFRRDIPDDRITRFVGIDPSEVAVRKANQNGWRRSEFLVATVPDPALGKFDIIVLNEVLYYSHDVDDLLRRCEVALNDGGWILSSITRHTGDFVLRKKLDDRFDLVDAVTIISGSLYSKWRLACHAKRGGALAPGKTYSAERSRN